MAVLSPFFLKLFLFTTPQILSYNLIILSPRRCQSFSVPHTTLISNRAMLCDLFRFNQMNWFCLVSWLYYDLIFSDSASSRWIKLLRHLSGSQDHISVILDYIKTNPDIFPIAQVPSHRITAIEPNYSCTLKVIHKSFMTRLLKIDIINYVTA